MPATYGNDSDVAWHKTPRIITSVLSFGALQLVGINPGFLAVKEKSANNAHGAYNGSYAIMRAELKGASNEQHCTNC